MFNHLSSFYHVSTVTPISFTKITRHSFFISNTNTCFLFFLQDAENIYFNCPHFLALRTALIQHLEYNTDVTVHTEFSNCLSPEWNTFLEECYPHFLVVSDEGITARQTDFLNIFIIHALQKKINIVQPLGLESDVLRIYGYHTSSRFEHRQFFEMVSQVELPKKK